MSLQHTSGDNKCWIVLGRSTLYDINELTGDWLSKKHPRSPVLFESSSYALWCCLSGQRVQALVVNCQLEGQWKARGCTPVFTRQRSNLYTFQMRRLTPLSTALHLPKLQQRADGEPMQVATVCIVALTYPNLLLLLLLLQPVTTAACMLLPSLLPPLCALPVQSIAGC